MRRAGEFQWHRLSFTRSEPRAGALAPAIQRCPAKARASSFVPRTNAVRAGSLLAVAGRIIRNVARSSSQLKPAAAVAANIVAITNVAKLSMAIMMCLPCCDFLYRTVAANHNTLKIKDLKE
jgi:hypothetical protein